MFHKKNIDYVYLLWEDFMFQIENKEAKKTNKMAYPRFTKIIIAYFMLKDQSISRRNKMFWHTTRDDTMFISMRCISRNEKTQVYGTILLKELTNQAMLESKAYKTYYAFSSGEKTPKPKYVRKKADSITSPKKKHVQATKGTRLKIKAKVAKSDKKKQPAKKPKAKGLAVLSEVALTKAKQLKLATKRSKTQFHSSHASGSGDGVDTQSKVPDEQQQKTSGTNKETGTIPRVPDVPIYDSESNKESWEDSDEEVDDEDDFEDDADNNDDDSDDNDEKEEEYDDEFNIEEDEKIDEEDDDEVTKELYKDLNVNLGNKYADMTDADQGGADQQNVSQQLGFEQEEEDAYVTLIPVLDTQKTEGSTQSSYVSSDFTSKLLNLDNPSPADNEIASVMDTTVHHAIAIPEITSSFTTTIPPPPSFCNPLSQQATPTLTPTATETTTSLPVLLDFTSIFIFNERVTNLEKDMSEIKQVDQYASSFQPQSSYEAAATLFEFELTKILIDKMEKNKLFDIADYKRELYDALVKSYNTDKDIFESYGSQEAKPSKDSRSKENKSSNISKDASKSQHKSFGKSDHAEEPSYTVEDSCMQQDQEFVIGDNDEQLADMEKYDYDHLEEIEVHRDDQKLYTYREGDFKRLHLQDIEDMLLLLIQQRLTNLTIDKRYHLNVALHMYTRRIVIQRRVEDLQLGVESYQKNLNLTKPDTYRSNLKNKTAYTSYSDSHGIIYVD
nr:hypothetical protein [Tanacetum cinerariifolium]